MANAPVTGPSRGPIHDSSWLGGGAGSVRLPWDLIRVAGEPPTETFQLWGARVFKGLGDLSTDLSLTNTVVTPVADRWLVAKITDLSTLAITTELLTDWTDYDDAYEFDSAEDYAFVAARLPLWRFYSDEAEGRVLITEGVYGEKMVSPHKLRVDFGFFQTGGPGQRAVPFFV